MKMREDEKSQQNDFPGLKKVTISWMLGVGGFCLLTYFVN